MFGLPETPWIWLPEPPAQDRPRLALFRRALALDAVPASARIRISADTRYKLYVNGSLAALGPAKGDDRVWYADTVDVAPWLRAGENVLAVEVLHYPAAGQTNQSLFHSATPGLFVEDVTDDAPAPVVPRFSEVPRNALAAIFAPRPSAGLDVRSDGRWRCRACEGFSIVSENPFFGPLQILEDRAGAADLAGWREPGYDDAAWEAAAPYDILRMKAAVSPADLEERPIPAMRLEQRRFAGTYGRLASASPAAAWDALLAGTGAVRVAPHAKESVEISAGEEMCGFLRLSLAGGAGARVRIVTSECYVEECAGDLMATQKKGDRTDAERGTLAGFTDVYAPAGAGTPARPEVYEPFWFRTFRFVALEIETTGEPLTVLGFDYLETGYPLEVATAVKTSDASLADIWDISLRSLRRCMHETYVDCPFYEQLQYLMDARSQMLFTYAVSADDRLARHAIEMFSHAQRPDGMLNASYPNTEANVIPSFSIYYILMLHDHMRYFGDRAFCRRYLGVVDRILGYFDARLDPRGVVGQTGTVNMGGRYWSFIDWSSAWDATSGMPPAGLVGPLTAESLLYAIGLERAADLASWLDLGDLARAYRERACAVRRAVRGFCRDDEGFFLDGPGFAGYSQQSQVLAVLAGAVSPEEGRTLIERALDDPERFATCSIAFYYYLFRALEMTGLYERTDRLWDLWRGMLDRHLTTCVENDTSERSDCHARGARALYDLPATVLGVRPAAPGFARIEVRPHPGALTSASGTVATPCGPVRLAWEKRPDGTLAISCERPEGVPVTVAGAERARG